MTGYGSGSTEATRHNLQLRVEITSVNRKSLDLNLSTSKDWSGIEPHCKEWLKGSFERGRVQVHIKALPRGSDTSGLDWNEQLMGQALQRIKDFAEKQNISFVPDGRLLLELARNLKDESTLPDWRELTEELQNTFQTALDDLNAMREKEGAALQKDLLKRIGELEKIRAEIEGHAKETVHRHRDALIGRLSQLGLELDLSDDRVLKEIALFADRCDISEEITRLSSHFEQFNELLVAPRPGGRKMDFLCQEIHREFNTIGSKANHIEITRAVIEGKNNLERIREQVQNVE